MPKAMKPNSENSAALTRAGRKRNSLPAKPGKRRTNLTLDADAVAGGEEYSKRHGTNLSQLAISAALVLFPALTGCHRTRAVGMALIREPAAGIPVYDGDITIDPATRAITARWSIAFLRAPDVDSITLLLNRGLTVRRVNGTGVQRFSLHRDDDFSQVVVHLTAAHDSRTARIDIAYDGVLELSSDSINIVTPDWVELSVDNFWHPVFADLSQQIVGRARVLLPSGFRGIASGTAVMRGDTLEIANSVPLFEFAFAASPRLATTEMGKARAYYVDPPPARVAALLDVVNACANDLNAQFGSRSPLRQIDLLLPPRGGPGYARRRYIAISRGANTTPTRMAWFICHELAHNWSQGAVVTGPENWLNEGFAEYIAGRSVRRIFGDSAYSTVRDFWRQRAEGQPPVWTPSATARPGERVSYAKAPLLLDSLERRVGIPTMDRMLVRFMTEPLRTTPAVLRMFADVAGPEAAAWFRQALGG